MWIGWRTCTALGVAALALTVGAGQYGARTLPRHGNSPFWIMSYDAGAQTSVWLHEETFASDLAVYAVPMPGYRGSEARRLALPRWASTTQHDVQEATHNAQAGRESRWHEVACGWPLRSLNCVVASPTDIRGGWFAEPPRDEFDAQIVHVVPWRPIPLGFFVDWMCALLAMAFLWFSGVGILRGVRAIVRRRTDPTRCTRCGYSLAGLPGLICPECGQPFSDNPALGQANADVQSDPSR